MNDISKEILSEIERSKITAFSKDRVLFEAVKKYILAVVYKHGVVNSGETYNGAINYALNLVWGATERDGEKQTDAELGQNLRAMTYATKLVESGFRELASIKEPEPLKESVINVAE